MVKKSADAVVLVEYPIRLRAAWLQPPLASSSQPPEGDLWGLNHPDRAELVSSWDRNVYQNRRGNFGYADTHVSFMRWGTVMANWQYFNNP